MMLTRSIRIKLWTFVLVSLLSVTTIAFSYMRLGERLGIGVYDVTLQLPEAGGLYPDAQVSYRGVAVGVVKSLDVDAGTVNARLQLRDEIKIPADLTALVLSTTAIGEQYVDLVPKQHRASSSSYLTEGDQIAQSNVVMPTKTAELLRSSSAFMKSLPASDIKTVVDELGAAFQGDTAQDLGALLDSTNTFQQAANDNLQPTMALLGDLERVLETQDGSAADIASYADDAARVTDVLAERDPELRELIQLGTPFLDSVSPLLGSFETDLPPLVADVGTTANVLKTFNPSLDHLLTVFPALVASAPSVLPPAPENERGVLLAFKTTFNDPPVCTKGFTEANKQRSPLDFSPKPPPKGSYCKVPHDDPRSVRGARNLPCVNNPSQRAATPAECGLVFPRFGYLGLAQRPQQVAGIDPLNDTATTSDGTRTSLRSLAIPNHGAPGLAGLLVPQLKDRR